MKLFKVLELLLYSSLLVGLTADHHFETSLISASTAASMADDPLYAAFFPLVKETLVEVTPKLEAEAPEVETPETETPEVETPETETPEVEAETPEVEAETPEVEAETPEVEAETPEETPSVPEDSNRKTYYYGDIVPSSDMVDLSYFSDAAIIGDSRSQGLMLYSNLNTVAGNITGMGLSVFNVWDRICISTNSGSTTVLSALGQRTYSKVYISLGINSVGYPTTDGFYNNYSKLIDEIRKLQPNAVIYVQSILPVNEAIIIANGNATYFRNTVIENFNAAIQRLAVEKQLYYVDTYGYFLDSAGQLPSEASTDGIHLSVTYSKKWAEYLRSHTVDAEKYHILDSRL